tara:strand:- start:264 stop:542 length:279 start_codon:yes stop_codon:yes gene_type:complete
MPYIQHNNPIVKTGCGRRRIEQSDSPLDRTKTFTNPLTGRTRTVTKSGSIWRGNKVKTVTMSGGYKGHKSKTKYGLFGTKKSKPRKCKRKKC